MMYISVLCEVPFLQQCTATTANIWHVLHKLLHKEIGRSLTHSSNLCMTKALLIGLEVLILVVHEKVSCNAVIF